MVSYKKILIANENVEDIQIEKAVEIAFRELKRYIKTPVEKTIPLSLTTLSFKFSLNNKNLGDVNLRGFSL